LFLFVFFLSSHPIKQKHVPNSAAHARRLGLLRIIHAQRLVCAVVYRRLFVAAIRGAEEKIASARDLFLAFFWMTYVAIVSILLVVFVVRMGSSLERRSRRAHAMLRMIPNDAVRTDPGLAGVAQFLASNFDAGATSRESGGAEDGFVSCGCCF
jgi:hypothetical protein